MDIRVINLTNEDFKDGTLIFEDDNLYINITEHIIFEPNPNNHYKPNPDNEKYNTPAFSLGFHAILIITGNNVTIDGRSENGDINIIEYSDVMALAQRHGTIISTRKASFIKLKPKDKTQGPGDFGDSTAARNVTIKNIILGRSPHHGVHGNGNVDIIFDNVEFIDFEVAAIQLPGCKNASINNCRILGNRKDIPVNGKFSALRFLIQFVEELIYKLHERSIRKRSKSHRSFLSKILEQLYNMIDNIFDKYIKNRKIIYKDLVNLSGMIDGSTYGVGFGQLGVQIGPQTKSVHKNKHNIKLCPFKLDFIKDPDNYVYVSESGNNYPSHYKHNRTDINIVHKHSKNRSSNIFMKDCVIDNITCDIVEYTGIRSYKSKDSNSGYSGSIFNDFSGSVYNYDTLFETKRFCDKGDNISNLLWYQIHVAFIADKYNIKLGVSNIPRKLIKLYMNSFEISYPNVPKNIGNPINIEIFSKEDLYKLGYELVSRIDSMGHEVKGPFGIRLEATDGAIFDNVKISNISNISVLGQSVHDQSAYVYDNETLPGYKGCQTHGISICNSSGIEFTNIKINDIHSNNGDCYGIRILNGSYNINIDKISIDNITYGTEKLNDSWVGSKKNIETGEIEMSYYESSWPNMTPKCECISVADSYNVQISRCSKENSTNRGVSLVVL